MISNYMPNVVNIFFPSVTVSKNFLKFSPDEKKSIFPLSSLAKDLLSKVVVNLHFGNILFHWVHVIYTFLLCSGFCWLWYMMIYVCCPPTVSVLWKSINYLHPECNILNNEILSGYQWARLILLKIITIWKVLSYSGEACTYFNSQT